MGLVTHSTVRCGQIRASDRIYGYVIFMALAWAGLFWASGCELPASSQSLQAHLELAAGDVTVQQGEEVVRVFSGSALMTGSMVSTGDGARALIRLSNGSAAFLRDQTSLELGAGRINLIKGEIWLDAPPTERDSIALHVAGSQVHAVEAGLSCRKTDGGAVIYAARGQVTVTAPGGRVELQSGEQATVEGKVAPKVEPVAFWEDWTGGMADHTVAGMMAGAGSGRIYGVDVGAPRGTPASVLEISRQSIRAVIRSGLAETEVDQTFFNPHDRPVEGWYWFSVPRGASVTGFAVETNGVLVEGEFIEKREAAKEYSRAVSSGHAPALLEWIDKRTCRARIYPVPATGTRRVVLRYLQLLPPVDGVIRYIYPLQAEKPVRIGEFSLTVDLGEEGRQMAITTLADARVEPGGQVVTMRRSGYTPRADFLLEAEISERAEPMRVARASAGSDTADYLMLRYTPDVEWSKQKELKGEVVVVVDTSAAGDEASRAMKVAAAEAILRALSSADRFALVSLDVRPKVLHPAEGLASASEENIAQALENLSDHANGGATDLSSLFDVALGRLHGASQPAVIYVGDGLATSGEIEGQDLVERMRRSLATSRARLFTVGVGPHANRQLLSALAMAGGGQVFHIGTAHEATERALQLVASLKAPTLTDFEIDLGAGLDEVFISANGKVKRGDQVVVLARTHHDLPSTVTIKGRLAGETIEREYSLDADEPVVASFVPRLWAAEYLRRLLGSGDDPSAIRGKVMTLGIEYGLMTPYTSILALESEAAYRQQGIPRRHSPLRGVRLSSLSSGSDGLTQRALNTVGFGCSVQSDAPASPMVQANTVEEAKRDSRHYEHKGISSFGMDKGAGGAAPGPAKESGRLVASKSRPSSGLASLGKIQGDQAEVLASPADDEFAASQGRRKNRNYRRAEQVMQTCSDAAKRPLRQRVILWRKRLKTARTAQDLIHRYQSAWFACELPDWRSEATFFRVMQSAIKDEGTAAYVLQFFESQPATQRYLARLILRRAVDPRIIAVVERVLFKGKINWANVDIELSEIPQVEDRIDRLRQIMSKAEGDAKGIIRLVHLLVQANRMEEALVQGRRLRDTGLTTPFLSRELGDMLAQNKKDDEAVRTYSEIVEFDPNNLKSRQLLGDIYLSHGWYDPAYRQYKLLTDNEPDNALFKLRLAASAAGAGRVDEALRMERQVAREPGRPGPDDPRRWARLWSAARLARMIAQPPKSKNSKKLVESMQARLKELQLFRGPGTLVLLTWEDLSADLSLATDSGSKPTSLGEAIDASRTGLYAMQLSAADLDRNKLRAHRRNPAGKLALTMTRQEIRWDGKEFKVAVTRHQLAHDASFLEL